MSATVTEWAGFIDGEHVEHERRYIDSGALAAHVRYIDHHKINGELRPWRMTVFRCGETMLYARWHYATLDEAIAGADDELSAIVPGLRSET